MPNFLSFSEEDQENLGNPKREVFNSRKYKDFEKLAGISNRY
tara:strand:- start:2234 stop:2359 length:126 start_codon:yes stop_codon:yes gene_type:complete